MESETARRLRDDAGFREFMDVLKSDIECLKEDILREGVDLLVTKTKILTIRLVMNRLDNIIEVLEEPVRSQS